MLTQLAKDCPHQGTSCKEGGIRVHIAPTPQESVVFFWTDCTKCRTALGIPPTDPISDAAAYYKSGSANPVFLFLELKSSRVGHAFDQIARTYDAIVTKCPPGATVPPGEMRGLVVLSKGAPPLDLMKHLQRLKRLRPHLRLKCKGGQGGKNLDLRKFFVSWEDA